MSEVYPGGTYDSSTGGNSLKNSKNSRTQLKGWTYIGGYGFSHIYAKGDRRRLVDLETGKITFEYRVEFRGKKGVRLGKYFCKVMSGDSNAE